MVLDIPGKLLGQSDVRETPISTATATAVGLTDGKYVVLDYHADMTDERKLTSGTGVDITDGGANSTITLSSNDGEIDHDALNNFAANEHFTEASIDHSNIDELDYASANHTGFEPAKGADDNFVTDAEKVVIGNTSGSNTGDQDTTYTANETNITLVGTEFRLKNKTSYLAIPGIQFKGRTPDVSDIMYAPNGGCGVQTTGGGVALYAPVNLPHGAVVTGVVVYASVTTENWFMIRSNVNAAQTVSTMATAALDTEDTSITNATIDNSAYTYMIGTDAMDATDIIDGARITYTTNYI